VANLPDHGCSITLNPGMIINSFVLALMFLVKT